MKHFRATLAPCLVTALMLCATPASADDICGSARQCADIVVRHAPDSFDYDVLASEVARLGTPGAAAIEKLAGDPDTAANAYALAARPRAPRALKARLLARWPEPSPELHIALAENFQDPSVRVAALRTLNTPALREPSIRLLATQTRPLSPAVAQSGYPALAKAATKPVPEILDLLAQIPGERAAPLLVRALSSGDAKTIVSAFVALSELNPAQAEGDLLKAFNSSPPDHAGAWVVALERAGLTVPTFDAAAFGYTLLGNPQTPPGHRAVALHTVLLEPAGPKGQVRGNVSRLMPIVTSLPVSDRLATTAASHSGLQNAQALGALLAVWEGKDSESSAEFARSLGRARPPAARSLLRGLFGRTGDYRVQVAVVEALAELGGEDADWIAGSTRAHPLRVVVDAGAKASGKPAPRPLPGCRPQLQPLEPNPQRMPYFQSGRYADGRTASRWELNDAQPIPGGWLGGYHGGLVRYGSDDTAGATRIEGEVVAILPDTAPAPGQRASVFWVLTRGSQVARLTRYDINAPIPAPSTLPRGVQVVRLGDAARARFGGRGWGLAFGEGEQATLVVTKEGRILPVCAQPEAGPFTPPRL